MEEQIIKNLESRFYHALPDRCFRKICLPIDVFHSTDIEKYRENLVGIKKTFLKKSDIDDQFIVWLSNNIGLEIDLLRLFINLPNSKYSIHVDRADVDDQSVALNYAFDDQDTIHFWYNLEQESEVIKKINETGRPFYHFKTQDCKEILSVKIEHIKNQPILFNTGYLHSLQIGNTNRFCYSYLLRKKGDLKPLQWDEALKLFSPYIRS